MQTAPLALAGLGSAIGTTAGTPYATPRSWLFQYFSFTSRRTDHSCGESGSRSTKAIDLGVFVPAQSPSGMGEETDLADRGPFARTTLAASSAGGLRCGCPDYRHAPWTSAQQRFSQLPEVLRAPPESFADRLYGGPAPGRRSRAVMSQ
jgi:hypothetical protein